MPSPRSCTACSANWPAPCAAGLSGHAALLAEAAAQLSAAGFAPDYLEIRNPLTLRPATTADRQLVILAAARLGTTRLIDNLLVDLDATA